MNWWLWKGSSEWIWLKPGDLSKPTCLWLCGRLGLSQHSEHVKTVGLAWILHPICFFFFRKPSAQIIFLVLVQNRRSEVRWHIFIFRINHNWQAQTNNQHIFIKLYNWFFLSWNIFMEEEENSNKWISTNLIHSLWNLYSRFIWLQY